MKLQMYISDHFFKEVSLKNYDDMQTVIQRVKYQQFVARELIKKHHKKIKDQECVFFIDHVPSKINFKVFLSKLYINHDRKRAS